MYILNYLHVTIHLSDDSGNLELGCAMRVYIFEHVKLTGNRVLFCIQIILRVPKYTHCALHAKVRSVRPIPRPLRLSFTLT